VEETAVITLPATTLISPLLWLGERRKSRTFDKLLRERYQVSKKMDPSAMMPVNRLFPPLPFVRRYLFTVKISLTAE
jgi:hypothetical protein